MPLSQAFMLCFKMPGEGGGGDERCMRRRRVILIRMEGAEECTPV